MLKPYVADLNQVDEAVRSFYVEKDGKFVLNVTPTDGWALEDVEGLKTALGRERQAREKLEGQVKSYEGIDPETAKKNAQKVERYSKFDPEKEADRIAEEKYRSREEQLVSKHSQTVKKLEEALDKRTAQLRKTLVESAIKSEVAKLNPIDAEAVELIAARSVVLKDVDGEFHIEVVDERGNPRIKDVHGNPMDIPSYLQELREKRSHLFKADERSGIGMKPNTQSPSNSMPGVKNPWAKESWNLTEQMKLMIADPAKAERLKAMAGA